MFIPGMIQGSVGIVLLIAVSCINKKEKSRTDMVIDPAQSGMNVPLRFAQCSAHNEF
jgi:hypothetical protein